MPGPVLDDELTGRAAMHEDRSGREFELRFPGYTRSDDSIGARLTPARSCPRPKWLERARLNLQQVPRRVKQDCLACVDAFVHEDLAPERIGATSPFR